MADTIRNLGRNKSGSPKKYGQTTRLDADGRKQATVIEISYDEPTLARVVIDNDPGMVVQWTITAIGQDGRLANEAILTPGADVFAFSITVSARVTQGAGEVRALVVRMVP